MVEFTLAGPVNALADCLESAGLGRGDDGWRPEPEIGLVVEEDTHAGPVAMA